MGACVALVYFATGFMLLTSTAASSTSWSCDLSDVGPELANCTVWSQLQLPLRNISQPGAVITGATSQAAVLLAESGKLHFA
jgi:hypothetical protein